MRHTRQIMLIALFVMLFAPYSGNVDAQDGEENLNPEILICAEEAGCFHSEKSGEITVDQMTALLGENDTEGNTVVCTPSDGCQWSAPNGADLDLLFGGNGMPSGEKNPPLELPEDSESDLLFPEMEVKDDPIVPVDGIWMGQNLAGVMDCGVMTIDIPEDEPQGGELIVEDDGAVLTLQSNDPEMGIVPMIRVQNGVYHATLEMAVEGDTMTLDYDELFVAPTMAIGMISGKLEAQGVECVIKRPFYSIVEGLELIEAGPVFEESTDTDSDAN